MENVPPPPGLGWAARGTKRTHSQMSARRQPAPSRTTTRSPSAISTADTSTPTHSTSSSEISADSGSHSQPSPIRLPSFREFDAMTPRFADFPPPRTEHHRTAAPAPSASTPMDVIDLTNDDDYVEYIPPPPPGPTFVSPFGHAQRGPRFPAEIIDLSGDTPQRPWHDHARDEGINNDDTTPQDTTQPHSPEVQFVGVRPLSPRLRFAGTTPPAHLVPNRLNPAGHIAPIEIPDDDEIQIIEERRRPPQHAQPPLPIPARFGNLIAAFGAAPAGLLQDVGFLISSGPLSHRRARRRGGPAPRAAGATANFEIPNLDFGFAAFDLGYGAQEEARTEREESVIPPPPQAPEGFTRNPGQEDELMCPNCEAELSVGEDGNEVKRQVWLIKGCGHIYCGECAASRLVKYRKGKEPANQKVRPLKKCVVEGCTSKSTGKQMIQLFL